VTGSSWLCCRGGLANAVLDEPIRRAAIDIDDGTCAMLDAGMGVDLEKFDLRHGLILSG
jgi:hypothetical protein